jgi:hypothetical protein
VGPADVADAFKILVTSPEILPFFWNGPSAGSLAQGHSALTSQSTTNDKKEISNREKKGGKEKDKERRLHFTPSSDYSYSRKG